MTFNVKKYLLLTCIITISSSSFAMENSEPHTPPQKKRRQSPPRPARACYGKSRTLAQTFDALPDAKPAARPTKRIRMDQPDQRNLLDTLFTMPDIAVNIMPFLKGSEFSHFTCLSHACYKATELARENFIANELSKREISPIKLVLDIAQGNETVKVFGIQCRTEQLVHCLLRICDPSNELTATDLEDDLGAIGEDLDEASAPETLKNKLWSLKFVAAQPTKYVAISTNRNDASEDQEAQLISQIREINTKFPNHTIALDLAQSDEVSYFSEITESLTEKLAPYPIMSLHCFMHNFPRGLACLTKLKTLRELHIKDCTIKGNSIPDELCKGLPLLNVLAIYHSHISSISPLIDQLKHLVVLDLSDNTFTEIPTTLHNLSQLKVLHLDKEHPGFSAQQLSRCLPETSNLIHLSLSHNGDQNPLPAACSLNQLRSLKFTGNAQCLAERCKQLKNLRKLILFEMSCNQLPSWIATLDHLKYFAADLDEEVDIRYDDFLRIANKVDYLSLFISPINQTIPLKKVAHLWQLIQTNISLINEQLALFPHEAEQHQSEIDTIQLLSKSVIKASELLSLISNNSVRSNACEGFIDVLLAHVNFFILREDVMQKIKELFHAYGDDFVETQKLIFSATCVCKNRNTPFLQFLVTTMLNIWFKINCQEIISDEECNDCGNQLKLCVNDETLFEQCRHKLANLFFHRAIHFHNITNAATMLKYGADINSLCPLDNTALHIAIQNRESTNDENLKNQIDHVICFLIKNGASLDKTNGEGKTPLDLIPRDSSLNEKINLWRTQ